MSPLAFIAMLLLMIIMPTILYTLFFLINCQTNPLQFLRHRSSGAGDGGEEGLKRVDDGVNGGGVVVVAMSSLELGKETECPVCLSVYIEGEELKQLNNCKHLFHKCCIDMWLSSHFSCPVCRAFVFGQVMSKKCGNYRLMERDLGRGDLWQGLPDSAGLI